MTDEPFIAPVAMEQDPDGCFTGDRGVLEPAVRRVLVRLLTRRFLLAERNKEEWAVLLDNQQVIESRLHDLFVRLVVDAQRGVAYKQQVRIDDVDVPILLRDDPYTRAETLVLIYLRTIYQRETVSGEASARVDVEDVEQHVLSYFVEADSAMARRQREIRKALDRLTKEGLLDEESQGRYRISPLVEIVLSAERLSELTNWLKNHGRAEDEEPSAIGDDEL